MPTAQRASDLLAIDEHDVVSGRVALDLLANLLDFSRTVLSGGRGVGGGAGPRIGPGAVGAGNGAGVGTVPGAGVVPAARNVAELEVIADLVAKAAPTPLRV